MSRTITVKGIGKIDAKPDYIELSLSISSKEISYEDTISKAQKMTDELKQAVTNAGFSPEQLKTTAFSVDTNYENQPDARGVYTRVFKGFVCKHDFTLSFDLDMAKLTNILSQLCKCDCTPQFTISFTIKNKDALKDVMLQNAVTDAKHKAEVLSKASNLTLGIILSIDYSWDNISLYSPTAVRSPAPRAMNAFAMDAISIEPDNIKAEDNISVVWELE